MQKKYLLILVLILGFIGASISPGVNISTKEILFFRVDYIVHFFSYFVLSISLYYLFNIRKRNSFVFLLAILVLIVIAISTECIQILIPKRQFDFADMILNISGVLVALIIMIIQNKVSLSDNN